MAKRRMHLMGYVVAGPTWHHNGSWRHARSDVPDLLSASETVQNLGVITPVRSDGHVVRFEMRRNHPQVLDGLIARSRQVVARADQLLGTFEEAR